MSSAKAFEKPYEDSRERDHIIANIVIGAMIKSDARKAGVSTDEIVYMSDGHYVIQRLVNDKGRPYEILSRIR